MTMALQHELNDALASVLDEMQQSADSLFAALEAERAALDAGDTEALDRVGSRKQALMQQLEQLDAERRSLRREPPAGNTALGSAWTRVMQTLRRCHTLNQRNGSTVNQRLTQVRQALAILTGHPGESELYGRSGELHGSLRSQVLAAV